MRQLIGPVLVFRRARVAVRCSCGAYDIVRKDSFASAMASQCRRCACKQANMGHGHSPKGNPSPTYVTWQGMLARCETPSAGNYKSYGARGVAVCDRWHRFEHFLEDMGKRPEGASIDRIDSDGNYEPSNCRWADNATQHANRRRHNQWTPAELKVGRL